MDPIRRLTCWLTAWLLVSIWVDSVRYELADYARIALSPGTKFVAAVLDASWRTGLYANGIWYLDRDTRPAVVQHRVIKVQGRLSDRATMPPERPAAAGPCDAYHGPGPTLAVILGPGHPCYHGGVTPPPEPVRSEEPVGLCKASIENPEMAMAILSFVPVCPALPEVEKYRRCVRHEAAANPAGRPPFATCRLAEAALDQAMGAYVPKAYQ
jgi:hypothetical protein